jgi:hypothetical protein
MGINATAESKIFSAFVYKMYASLNLKLMNQPYPKLLGSEVSALRDRANVLVTPMLGGSSRPAVPSVLISSEKSEKSLGGLLLVRPEG